MRETDTERSKKLLVEKAGRRRRRWKCVSPLSRALELAVKHKTHVDTVLAFRQKYLKDLNCEESLKKFKQYSQQVSHHPLLQL